MRRQGTYFLKASLTFSPASLRLAFAWSPLPSFSVLLSPVTLPTASLALPPRSWALFFALSAPLTASPTSRDRPRWPKSQPVGYLASRFPKRQKSFTGTWLEALAGQLADPTDL